MPRKANLTSVVSALTAAPGFNPCQYKLSHSGDQDPTSQQWRDNHAPASYQWIPYRGILVDEGDPITDMTQMFNNNTTFNDPDIGNWDVSAVTDMRYMFNNALEFNQDISGWNVDAVTDMSFMFVDSKFNQDISNWNVSNVTKMDFMFRFTPFNQDISSWNVSNVINMNYMFENAYAFNQDLSGWNVTSMGLDTIPVNFATGSALPTREFPLFGRDGSQLKYYPMNNSGATDPTHSNWRSNHAPSSATWIANRGYITDIADPITSMEEMFYNDTADRDINDSDLQYWNVSSVTNMSSMFREQQAFNQDLSGWNVSNVTDMSHMFENSISFNYDIGDWNVSSVTDMSWMFKGCPFNQDISGWNTSSLTNMSYMFYGNSFNQPIGNWNTSLVTDMSWMFSNTSSFNQDISGWNTSSVTDMSYMFYGASSFNQDLTSWDVSSVTNYADFATGGNSSWTLKPTKNVQTSGSFTFSAVQWETTNNNSTTRYISWPLFSTTAAVSDVNSISVSNISQTKPTGAGTAQTLTLQNSTNGAPTQQVYTISSSATPPASSFYSGSVLPYIISNGVSLYMVMKLDTTATMYTTYQQWNGFFYQTIYRYFHMAVELVGDFDMDYTVTF